MTIKIYGGGIAGLIAAHTLRKFQPVIYEAQPQLPHNHEALLRFRDESVSVLTGIPFKRVKVLKGICYDGEILSSPNLRLANQYSLKTNGSVRGRSIMNLEPSERWIAPSDFISRLSEGLDIRYSTPLTLDLLRDTTTSIPKVSTIPMPLMMKMVNWEEVPEFSYSPIWAVTMTILSPEVDVYQTLYFPGPEPYYRCSITGNKLIMEFQKDPSEMFIEKDDGYVRCGKELEPVLAPAEIKRHIEDVAAQFGIFGKGFKTSEPMLKEQRFGKIVPIDDTVRRGFIMACSEAFNCYSLGRFATWKPSLLAHDVQEDAQVIANLISHKDAYGRQLAMLKNQERM